MSTAWQQYYDFKFNDNETMMLQIEKFENLCKKLENLKEKPTEKAMISKVLNNLTQRFSAFRMAWECTSESSQKFQNLTARIIREDKRLNEAQETMSTLALQVNSMNLRKKTAQGKENISDIDRQERAKKIRELKRKTKCNYCKQGRHLARECCERREAAIRNEKECHKKEENSDSTETYICDISALQTDISFEEKDVWIADTGASMHMTPIKEFFCSLETARDVPYVRTADNKSLRTAGIGTVNVQVDVEGKFYDRQLVNVLYVPGLKRNLFSVEAVNDKGLSFHSYKTYCEVRNKDNKVSSVGVRYRGNLFRMLFQVKTQPPECNLSSVSTLKLWHERMGHINVKSVKITIAALGLKVSDSEPFFCEPCILGKQTRKPHKTTLREKDYKPGEMIHTDVCGPVNITSPKGSKYFILFKDECTDFRKVSFLRHKSEAFEEFKKFEATAFRQTGNKIKVLRLDNGTEYLCHQFIKFLENEGIIHELSAPYIHEQKGHAEREIRTLVNSARTMIIPMDVSRNLWPEAVSTAAYILNRVVIDINEIKTPHEKWFQKKPEVKHLKTFGINAYMNIPKEKRENKFAPKSKKLLLVGYEGE